MRKDESPRSSIMYLARNVPHLLTNEEVDRIGAEWRIYEMADIPDEWIKKVLILQVTSLNMHQLMNIGIKYCLLLHQLVHHNI